MLTEKPILGLFPAFLLFLLLSNCCFAEDNFRNSPVLDSKSPIVLNDVNLDEEETAEDNYEHILVVMLDMYGNRVYSKIIITDIDMETSILIAKDILQRVKSGIYIVISSSANDLVSHRLIVQ
ncbi:MAG: hypothetical protein COA57_00890 [Flavobacteriales bacterium]|nr:MAG: hypothetical protein COA57_00890 [Flavobacteriales bacterium]